MSDMYDDLKEGYEKMAYCMVIGAVEGGSSYWCRTDYRETWNEDKREGEAFSERLFRKVWREGETLTVYDAETVYEVYGNLGYELKPKEEWVVLGTMTRESMEKAFEMMRENHFRHYRDMMKENDDAITADVWFQLATLGELVYG